MSKDVAVLGVGMHPWGKWGQSFVKYGVAAARAALADSGVNWQDVDFIVGGETVRNGSGGYVAGATFAQALGWNGARVATSYAVATDRTGSLLGASALSWRLRDSIVTPYRSAIARQSRSISSGVLSTRCPPSRRAWRA